MNATRIMLTAIAAGAFLGTLAGTMVGADPKRPLEPAWPHNPAPPDVSTMGYQFTQSTPEDLTPPWTLDGPHPLFASQLDSKVPDYVPKLAEYHPLPLPPPLADPPRESLPEPAYSDDDAVPVVQPAAEPAMARDEAAPHRGAPDQAVAQALGNQLWSADSPKDAAPQQTAANS